MQDYSFLSQAKLITHKLTLSLAMIALLTVQASAFPRLLGKNTLEQSSTPYAAEKLSLIPDNFNFSQKKSLLGRLYIKLQKVSSKENAEQLSDAIEQLWLTSGSDQIDILMSNTLVAIEDKDYPKAIYILGKITELNPDYTEAWNKCAMVYFLAEDYSNAMTNLKRVLQLDPRHFQALNGVANILKETGHKKSALKAYRALLRINPFLQSAVNAEMALSREIEGQKT